MALISGSESPPRTKITRCVPGGGSEAQGPDGLLGGVWGAYFWVGAGGGGECRSGGTSYSSLVRGPLVKGCRNKRRRVRNWKAGAASQARHGRDKALMARDRYTPPPNGLTAQGHKGCQGGRWQDTAPRSQAD